MATKTEKSANGTSFHNVIIKASAQDLINIFGEPTIQDNTGEDKVNMEWCMETESGDVFTIYDWKYYRKLELDEIVEWNIGSHSRNISGEAQYEVMRELGNYVD